jgi:nucleotide-binding universal stress UspA family protein
MEKKILIAVDGSAASQRAVDYVGLVEGALIRELQVVLMYVMNPIPPFLRREGQNNPDAFRQLRALEKKNRAAARAALEVSRERLMRHGMTAEQIETRAAPRAADVARDLLFEAERGMYDALVIGRRGLSKTQELFMGGTTNKVVQHASRLPVWVVGGRVTSLKTLCPVDGSEGSLKAVDHMAFMLGGNPECRVTLFHVGAALANYCPLDFDQEMRAEIEGDLMHVEQECMDDFYTRAMKVLVEGGLTPDQVETKTVEGKLGVSSAVLKEMKAGGYGSVVLGRRGENRSFFLGHVSDKVVSKAGETAIWIVG